MPNKRFNTEDLVKELQQSAFFPPGQSPTASRSKPETQSKPPEQHRVSVETGKRGNVETHSPSPHPETSLPFHFDPDARADQKYTLAFTEAEMEIMEDVKLELRRRFGLKTTKVELVRCGLGELIEDYQKHGDQSRIVSRLKARK